MSAVTGFDPFNALDTEDRHLPPTKPFWTLDFDDEDGLLKWLVQNLDQLQQHAQPRVNRIRQNLSSYRGVQMQAQDIRTREILTRSNVPPQRNPTPINNALFDVVEQHVSRTTKYRPNIATVPANSGEHRDKMVAKIVDQIIHAIWYREDIDTLVQDATRTKRIMGEVYFMVDWDPNKGKEHPDSKKSREKGKDMRIPLVDDKGKQIMSMDGTPLFIERPVRIGDVTYSVALPWDVFLQRRDTYKNVEWAFYRKVRDVEDIRGDFPDKAAEIKANKKGQYFDVDLLTERQMMNQCEEIHFWHRSTDKLFSGRHIVFTRDTILVNEENPYEHRDFPWVRSVDIPSPGQLNGTGTVEIMRPMQNLHNNVLGMMVRNQSMVAHPKWMVPRGSCKVENLGNDITVVQFQGPVPPTLVKCEPTPREVFELNQWSEEKVGQLGGVHSVSRGEPPPGIKAGVALQFLDEQENERSNTSISQHNEMLRQIAIKTASLAGQHYDDNDDRLKDLLGAELAANVDFFKMADLSNIHDIRLETSSALPRQKAARVQTVIDLRESFPTRITEDQALDMLEFGTPDKFFDIGTKALRAAECENELILQGGKTAPPEIWEDQIVHYRIHVLCLNDRSYKEAPKKVLQALKDHVMGHEYLILQAAQKNPQILERILLEFPMFPMFYTEFEQLAQSAPAQQDIAAQLGQLVQNPQNLPQPTAQVPPEQMVPMTNEVPLGVPTPTIPNPGII